MSIGKGMGIRIYWSASEDWSDYVWDQAYDAQGQQQNGPLHGHVYWIENRDGVYVEHPIQVEPGEGL